MLKAIFSAIGAALKAAFSIVRAVISIPGRMLGAALGGRVGAPPEPGSSALVRDLEAELEAELEASRANWSRIAAIIATWCADSMIAGRPLPAPTPPRVTRAVADWLPGLTREECAELVCAGKEAVCEHVAGVCAIAGVRPVQRLQALSTWTPASAYVEPTPGFAAIAWEMPDAQSSTG
jgi:hypothetical protein